MTVSARQDADAVSDEATITHRLTGGDYANLAVASVAVTVLDDETASTSVALAVAPASVAEGVGTAGRAVTVTATLNAAPRTVATAVTVAVAAGTAGAADFAAVSDFPLTIAAGDEIGRAEFRLKPVDDAVDEADETVTVRGTAGGSGLTVAGAALTITDDDARGVTVSETALRIDEGAAGSYTVVLTSQPTADVTVAVIVPPGTGLAADPTGLTFTADDWDTAQTVTVTAAADDDALAPAPATLRHTVSGADYGAHRVRAAAVVVTIVETTAPALAIAGERAAESAGEMVFTVTLSTASSQPVIVDYASLDGTATPGRTTRRCAGRSPFPPPMGRRARSPWRSSTTPPTRKRKRPSR